MAVHFLACCMSLLMNLVTQRLLHLENSPDVAEMVGGVNQGL